MGEIGQKQYLSMFVTLHRALAMWPLDSQVSNLKLFAHRATICIVLSLLIFVSSSLYLRIFSNFEDMDGIATVIDFATVYTSGVFRYSYIFFRGPAYVTLVDTIHNQFSFTSFNNTETKMTMARMQKVGHIVGALYYFGSFVFILQMIFTPIFIFATATNNSSIPLIFDGWLPFDVEAEPTRSIIFVTQAVSWLLMGYHYLLIDAFWYMVIILTIGQLQIVAHSYRHLAACYSHGLDVSPESKVSITNSERKDALIETTRKTDCGAMDFVEISAEDLRVIERCVHQHQAVRNLIKQIENILCPIIIVDFMHAIISITFLMLDITIALQRNDWLKMLHLMEYLMVSIIHMFAYNWLGNELALQEEKVSAAMYGIPWYRSPQAIKASLTMVTSAGRNPIRLSGGKFYFLTLEFFVAAMRTIFSYFMVLFQLRNDDLNSTG